MAAIAVTYTFSNSTTADATQVNQNFTDIINGLSDGTKDISVNAGTFAGNVSFSGNTTIGNATGDDLTVTASLASSIPIKTTNTYDFGSSSLGLRALYFGANSQTVNIKASGSMSATWTFTLPVTAGTQYYKLENSGSGVSAWQACRTPTIQTFTSGSGTYTLPTGPSPVYIKIRMVGGGGGGSGSGTSGGNNGGSGGNTTFGTTLLVANGGGGGAYGGTGGGGGTASLGSGPIGIPLQGGTGGTGGQIKADAFGAGGMGASTPFGGSGGGGYNSAGSAGTANTGAGGGGGGSGNTAATQTSGSGGGAGGYVDAIIVNPSSTYSYAVGAAGAAGAGGTNGFNGAAGGGGLIIVEEHYP